VAVQVTDRRDADDDGSMRRRGPAERKEGGERKEKR